ncbi:3D domain-containing protein [Bdellovibrio bacteriovorus]|uniref:3D domain-containing protein n=1 Tax=Bdellovibrio bacteriovorus TaxID=959 RepID=UPI003AA9C1B8
MQTFKCLTQKIADPKWLYKPFVLFAMVATANASSSQLCKSGIATTSTYFVPHIKDYCSSSKPCKKFLKQVRMQGSGTLSGNRLLTYTGKTRSLGSCDTAFGASGKCLIPFFSVAADPRYYSMGDIIRMPALEGKRIRMPNGKTVIHPGYLIVHDTGGAIKGPNRFDMFTGSYGLNDKDNVFGYKGSRDMRMTDVNDCTKSFSTVRRNSYDYQHSLAMLEDVLSDVYSSKRSIASYQSYKKGSR